MVHSEGSEALFLHPRFSASVFSVGGGVNAYVSVQQGL
jgi:hypothetical protein